MYAHMQQCVIIDLPTALRDAATPAGWSWMPQRASLGYMTLIVQNRRDTPVLRAVMTQLAHSLNSDLLLGVFDEFTSLGSPPVRR